MKQIKKSPIKDKPLRYAGQSLDERIDKLIGEEIIPYIICSFFMVFFALYEWWRYFKNPPPSPKAVTFIALLFIFFTAYKVRKNFKILKNVRLGRAGERAVGQFLECLREKGYRIFHDIQSSDFNLDHVIISTKGIYVIETKTYSKPNTGEAKIIFDGKKLATTGGSNHTKPLIQARAAANWLKNMLSETTGKKFEVKPVILFPGWYISSTEQGRKSGIWVLNPKALPSYIENQPDIISHEDMMLASYHISRYIRTQSNF